MALGRAYIWCGSNSYLYSKLLKHQDLRFRVFQSSKNWDFLKIWVQRLGCFQALSLKNWILHKLISYIFPYFPLISYVYIYIYIYTNLSFLSILHKGMLMWKSCTVRIGFAFNKGTSFFGYPPFLAPLGLVLFLYLAQLYKLLVSKCVSLKGINGVI